MTGIAVVTFPGVPGAREPMRKLAVIPSVDGGITLIVNVEVLVNRPSLTVVVNVAAAYPTTWFTATTDGIDWADLLPRTGYAGTHLVEYEPLADTRDGIRRSLVHLRSVGYAI